ncbi:hypothetical protein IQ247_19340 [Plectonema cf. radiosum LEGE 06105]|uniref:Uncharacterized protein n=1 Tax=Plectonema cf. radiosum LEGE 06105 TaxID=945769 RepID=A0A8J7F2A5_9CYAN|nr:hypothetical protein [Plectonema radiosum]MBE9214798.1 hypothetical protein [Plectonema cf. radiosum LEGE 06105]
MKKNLFVINVIKIISTVLMIGAIGLELGHIYALKNHLQIPDIIRPILVIERVAVGVHLIEAIIASFKAGSKYGVYTFFVGTIGLVELFGEENQSINK